MLKYLFSVSLAFMSLPLMANDCLEYKKMPRVILNVPDWGKTVVQPRAPMDLWHGNVIATLTDNYDIIVDINPVDGGFCVALKTLDAVVGYNDFLVQIDIRHVPDTCAYNAVLSHEDKHIKTYLSVIDDFKPELQKSIFSAADSVMPIFVKNKDDVDMAVDMMNTEFQNHPDLILIKQKIKAAEEIKNKHVDRNEKGADLANCF